MVAMECSTVFTNPDNSTRTLEKICPKMCCEKIAGAAAEKREAEKELILQQLMSAVAKKREEKAAAQKMKRFLVLEVSDSEGMSNSYTQFI